MTTPFASFARSTIVLTAVALLFTFGCATPTVYKDLDFEPGATKAVESAKAKMTSEDAVVLVEKYIKQYLENKSTGEHFVDSFAGTAKMGKVDTNGFIYSTMDSVRYGGNINFTIAKREVQFADVTRLTIRMKMTGTNETAIAVSAFTNNTHVLSCNLGGSPHLVNRVLAAFEVLCPNIQYAPAVQEAEDSPQ